MQHNSLYAESVYKCLPHFFSNWGVAQRFLQSFRRVYDPQKVNSHKSKGFPLSIPSVSQRVDVTCILGLREKTANLGEAQTGLVFWKELTNVYR